jgi:glycosyltransferase involved in cell wall biosynthesis
MPGSLPQRVLMTTDAVGGVWEYSLELASGLCRRGISVLLAAMGPEASVPQQQAASAIRGLTLVHRPYRLEWMSDFELDLLASAAWLGDLASDFDPDIVHVNGYAHACLPLRCPVVVVCHSCVCSWWQAVRGGQPPQEWNVYRTRVAAGLRKADIVIAPTRSFLATIERLYDIDPRRASVIPNGRSGGFHVGFSREPYVFACGRAWDEAKGFDIIDRLAARLPWPVFVAGATTGVDGSECREPKHAQVLGALPQQQLATWLAGASLFVLPARYEPFGLSILEAAMSGSPLVLSDLDTLRELWDGAAVFVPTQDEPALYEAVTTLMRDPLLRHEMAARAILRAGRYSADSMVEGYLQAYQQAALHHRGEGGGTGPIAQTGKEAVLNG